MEAVSVFIIVGLSFSLIFLIKRLTSSDYKDAQRLLPIALISVLTIELFYGWLYSSRFILQQPHLIRLNTPFLYIVGPSLYLLISSYSKPEMRWKRYQLMHLIPFLLAIVYLLPLYSSSVEDKTIYVKELYESLSFDSFLLGGTRRLHQGTYIIATALLLFKEKKTLRYQRELESSILITSAFTLLWLISIYRYFFSFDLLSGLIDTFLLSTIAIYLVYRQLSNKSSVSQHLSRREVDQMEREMAQIQNLLSDRKDYLNPQYSIKDLAQSLELTVPRVSKIINRTMGTNFNELINRYKVSEAISLLQSKSTRHLTIEAIANSAGFNSTSSFNDNFKRITGKSPKSYRA